ncbi:Xaa-Pro dipeptidase [Onishia taeanensis]|uniref:Xaa-Pro dipeptidase n=2 Tax=Onishia taeanensis TaxID=284577 RepID=A0A328XP92_9GAMM|nr:Xaa-Pro dipeptidase [Halomonas taeanensis]
MSDIMKETLEHKQLAHLETLQTAYDRLLTAQGFDGVLLYSGHPQRHFADDQHASFATYGHFMHWVPLQGLDHSWLLVRPGQTPSLQLHAPTDFWHLGTELPEEAWVEAFAVERVATPTPPRLPAGRFAVLGDVDSETARTLGAELNPPALTQALDEGRVRKSAYEIDCLREANRRAGLGHRAARDAFFDGGAELDIQLAYLGASRQRESDLPYQSIVGVNQHAAVLHYQHYELAAATDHHSLLIDAGHRHRGYSADITRTWAGGDASDAFAGLIEGVTTIQQDLIRAMGPGVDYPTLHAQMHQGLGALLGDLGMIKCSATAAVEQGITRAFCPHGLGHLLGLQVHDVAGRQASDGTALPPPAEHPALRLTRTLEAGMVVTMEPGCYVIPMLLDPLRETPAGSDIDWAAVEALAPHGGVRIEDNVLVTDQGAENLTPVI